MSRLAARLVVGLAWILLPASLSRWGRAMALEAEAIDEPGPRLRFAFGCLGGALRHALSLRALRPPSTPSKGDTATMPLGTSQQYPPRLLTALCALGATGLGIAYMRAAEAPPSYLAMNAAALLLGLLVLGVVRETSRIGRVPGGPLVLALACALLLTGLFGISADGARRWVSVGGIMLQPGLILVPAIAIQFVRARGVLSTLAVVVAAGALALQPDRGMAGAMAAGMAALAFVRPERNVLIALAAALAAFAVTMLRPDASPASAFVDQIFYSAFEVHWSAGLAVVAGAALMIVPAVVGLIRDPDNRASYAMFGAVWVAVLAAAALGNYPTPLVGYSGSAILGYMLSAIGLPARAGTQAVVPADNPSRSETAERPPALHAGLLPSG